MPDNVQRYCAYCSESEFKEKCDVYMCLKNCNLCNFLYLIVPLSTFVDLKI